MLTFRRVIFLCTVFGLIFSLISCQSSETPVPSQDTEIIDTENMYLAFKEGLDYINNREHFKYHSRFMVDAVYYKGFTKHRFFTLFNDPFLKAYSTNDTDEVRYRIAMFDEKPYYVYQHGNQFIKADQASEVTMSIVDYDQPLFGLLKHINKDLVTKHTGYYTFSYTYQEMITNHFRFLSHVDDMMFGEVNIDEDADLSSVTFEITVIMDETNSKSFETISIDLKEYMTLKYPLASKPQDRYDAARFTFQFSYTETTKDISAQMTYIQDDHQSFISEGLTEITLGEVMTADLQYMTDVDYFILIINETKTYHFEFTGIENVIFNLRNINNLKQSVRVNLGDNEIEQGTYYLYVYNYAETIGQVFFSFNEK